MIKITAAIVSGLIFLYVAFADDKLNVQIFNKHIKPSDFPEKHIQVNPGVEPKSELVAVDRRDSFYNKYGELKALTANMDQADRDILWVRLKSKSQEELIKLYPSLSKANLDSIKKEILNHE